ncbi:hypothetical protein NBO_43g0002 [Nosema bombycis CQ1]|uniref:Uncharacterized protein n=1 Tax=Nosema bombycis (strain CQ1 / CVCC 102059) TaxID=578461 RepID=R0KUV6_NOSB1|nr:hypothetical protein NBO_43g0002 [Nosema bombycis CQ1]|eukprot:EOB13997.1 hypothetical protein NBO_43g0002 [Nosema bombycis CQ1]
MDTITLFYEANFISKRDQYKNEDDIYGMVILREMPLMFRKRDVQCPNIVNMFIKLFNISFKYIQNLFRNNKEQEITLRNKNEFKKSRKKKNSIYEKSIIIKINSIEQEISKLEKNLDNLINHMKETPSAI